MFDDRYTCMSSGLFRCFRHNIFHLVFTASRIQMREPGWRFRSWNSDRRQNSCSGRPTPRGTTPAPRSHPNLHTTDLPALEMYGAPVVPIAVNQWRRQVCTIHTTYHPALEMYGAPVVLIAVNQWRRQVCTIHHHISPSFRDVWSPSSANSSE